MGKLRLNGWRALSKNNNSWHGKALNPTLNSKSSPSLSDCSSFLNNSKVEHPNIDLGCVWAVEVISANQLHSGNLQWVGRGVEKLGSVALSSEPRAKMRSNALHSYHWAFAHACSSSRTTVPPSHWLTLIYPSDLSFGLLLLCLLSCFDFVLRYNLHSIKCTNITCSAQWISTYVHPHVLTTYIVSHLPEGSFVLPFTGISQR